MEESINHMSSDRVGRPAGLKPVGQENDAMKTQTDSATQTPEEILNELRALVVEAERILGNDASRVPSEGTVAALRERLEAAQARLADFYETAKENVTKGTKYADRTIRANPYQSLAVALGVGVLAGVLLGRYAKK
jgi:ElaB/YqjD/DUF883 family membrane-anchored ribosome-binding protein